MKFWIQAPWQPGTNPQAQSLSVILELLRGQRFRRGCRLAIFSTTGVVLGFLAVTAVLHPGLSQGVQLVKVDIEVVEHGYRVSKLSGHAVVNDKNERIGKIDDFVIGQDEGHPVFTVLEIGGFLGIGSHLVAVPYDSLVIDHSGNKIDKIALPGASKEELQKLAEFRYGS
jgi:sporulation protein YlmC with PRC-barrel domain